MILYLSLLRTPPHFFYRFISSNNHTRQTCIYQLHCDLLIVWGVGIWLWYAIIVQIFTHNQSSIYACMIQLYMCRVYVHRFKLNFSPSTLQACEFQWWNVCYACMHVQFSNNGGYVMLNCQTWNTLQSLVAIIIIYIAKPSKITSTNKGRLSVIKFLGGMGSWVELRDMPSQWSPWESD